MDGKCGVPPLPRVPCAPHQRPAQQGTRGVRIFLPALPVSPRATGGYRHASLGICGRCFMPGLAETRAK